MVGRDVNNLKPDEGLIRLRVGRGCQGAAHVRRDAWQRKREKRGHMHAAGAKGGAVISETQKLVDSVNEYKANVDETQARLQRLQALLSRFEDKRAESKKAEVALAAAARSVSRAVKPCHFLSTLNADAIRKVMHFLDGKILFALAQTCTSMVQAQDDMELWSSKVCSEAGQEIQTTFDCAKEAKQMYLSMSSRWHFTIETFGWLAKMGYPCDIAGTRNGVPLHFKVLEAIRIAIHLTSRQLLVPARVRELSDVSLPALFSLIQSSNHTMQEVALALAANLMVSITRGRSAITRHGALPPLRTLLASNCLGLKKQGECFTSRNKCPRFSPAPARTHAIQHTIRYPRCS